VKRLRKFFAPVWGTWEFRFIKNFLVVSLRKEGAGYDHIELIEYDDINPNNIDDVIASAKQNILVKYMVAQISEEQLAVALKKHEGAVTYEQVEEARRLAENQIRQTAKCRQAAI